MSRIDNSNKGRRVPGPGYSVLGVAKETGLPEVRIRRAIKSGEIETISLGGTVRVPGREVERLKQLYV